jgi:hypothetical protein
MSTSEALIVTEGPAAPLNVDERVTFPLGPDKLAERSRLKLTAVPTVPVEGPVRVNVEGEMTMVNLTVAEEGSYMPAPA